MLRMLRRPLQHHTSKNECSCRTLSTTVQLPWCVTTSQHHTHDGNYIRWIRTWSIIQTSPHSNPEHVQVASLEINYRTLTHHRNMSMWLRQVQKLYTGQINLWKEFPRTIKGRTWSHRTDIYLVVGKIWTGNCRICAKVNRISVTVGFLLLNWKADLTWRHKQDSSQHTHSLIGTLLIISSFLNIFLFHLEFNPSFSQEESLLTLVVI